MGANRGRDKINAKEEIPEQIKPLLSSLDDFGVSLTEVYSVFVVFSSMVSQGLTPEEIVDGLKMGCKGNHIQVLDYFLYKGMSIFLKDYSNIIGEKHAGTIKK
jgi:hypothetical protein